MTKSGAVKRGSASKLISGRIAGLGDWRGDTLSRMRKLIKAADPDVVEEWKWEVPVWSHDGIICTGESYKKTVKLTFAKGAALKDQQRLFNSSLDGNVRRAIDIREGEVVNEAAFTALVREAVALNSKSASKVVKKAKAKKPKSMLLLAALCFAALARPVQAQTLTIENVTVVDVEKGRLLPRMTIVVDGKRISRVERTRAGSAPAGATMDGTGMFVIPGLWDMHIHAFFTNDSSRFHSTSELMLPLFIANGVTGVRDMGSNLDAVLAVRDSIAAHQLIGPRMLVAGPMLDGPTSRYQTIIKVGTAEEGRAAVRRLKDRGVDLIKVQSLVPREAYLGVAEESARLGLSFEGHVPNAIRAYEAITAHQHSFEHLLGVFEASSTREDSLVAGARGGHPLLLASHSDASEKEVIAALARSQVWQVPTLVSEVNTASDLVLDPSLPFWLRTAVDGWKRTSLRNLTATDTTALLAERRFDQYELGLVRKLHAAGVPFLAGTDAPAGFDLVPGASLHKELEWFVAAGFTPLEALRTATINPAIYFGRTADLGTVAAGKLADFVVLAGNPLANITNTRSVVAVVADGRFFSGAELNRLRLRLMDLAGK